MQDLQKLVELGKEFAEPWKKATKVLSVLLAITIVALLVSSYKKNQIVLEADYNSQSEISQTQG